MINAVEMSFTAKGELLRVIQQLVKRYDGRFLGNPFFMFNNQYRIGISFVNVKNANKFNRMLRICEQPYF